MSADTVTTVFTVTMPPETRLYMVLYLLARGLEAKPDLDYPIDLVELLEQTGHFRLMICPNCSWGQFKHREGCTYAK